MTTDSRPADAARAPGTDTWALRWTCRAAVGDLACGTKPAEPLRQRVCQGWSGTSSRSVRIRS